MKNEIKISNGYFHLWKAFLQQKNMHYLDLQLSHEQQIRVHEIFQQPIDQQVSYEFFMQIVEVTQSHIDCPDLAFSMAKCIDPSHFGLLGYMASRSENLAQALVYVIRFSRLVVNGDSLSGMQYVYEGQTIRIFFPFLDKKYIFLYEMTLAAMLYLAKQFNPSAHFPLIQMSFANPAQIALKYYQNFYQCQLKFEQALYEIIFSTEALFIKPEQADPNLIQILVKQAEETLLQRTQPNTIVEQLQFIVAEYLKLEQQAPKIQDIAKELYISVRTLQRQLTDAETSFKKILEGVRMQRCEILLTQNIALTDIALDLGYSDQSALARAYKAYSGQTLLNAKRHFKHKQDAILIKDNRL